MSDAELRELERRWLETRSEEDRARYLTARVRRGENEWIVRLDLWLSAERPELKARLRPGASEEDLAAAEAKLGRALPEDLRALYRWADGQGPNPNASGMPVPAFFDNFAFLSLEGVLGAHAGNPEYFRVLDDAIEFNPSWIPFLHEDFHGGYQHWLCLDHNDELIKVGWGGAEDYEPYHERSFSTVAHWLQLFVRSAEEGMWVPEEPSDLELSRWYTTNRGARFYVRENPGYPMGVVPPSNPPTYGVLSRFLDRFF